jgi:hypothetical protein
MSQEMSRLAMSQENICSECLRYDMLALSLIGMLRFYLPTDILVQLEDGVPQRQYPKTPKPQFFQEKSKKVQ